MSPEFQEALVALGHADRLLVALDFDGTISPIVAMPSAARPVPGALDLMARLGLRPGHRLSCSPGAHAMTWRQSVAPASRPR